MDRTYRVLLVDDEPLIIESLKVAIPWAEWGMEVAGEARNGQEALDVAQMITPDIIVSDIRMPGIDGITFMRRTMEGPEQGEPIFIIISGYGEFDYAREALRQGAFDYVLKPIDHDELENIIKKAKEKLDEIHALRLKEEQMQHSVRRLSVIAKERLYSEMLDGQAPSSMPHDVEEGDILTQPYYLVLVQLDREHSMSGRWRPEEKRLWYFAMDNILKEYGSLNHCLTVFPYYSGEWILLFPEMSLEDKRKLGSHLAHTLTTYSKLPFSIGISHSHIGSHHLKTSYEQAVHALYNRFISADENVFMIEEQDWNGRETTTYPLFIEKQLVKSLQIRNESGIEEGLSLLTQELMQSGSNKDRTKQILFELAVIAHRQLDLVQEVMNEDLYNFFDELEQHDRLVDMIQSLRNRLFEWMKSSGDSRSREHGEGVIAKAKRFIETNYQQDIGIDEVADYVQISFGHFCTLFKQETGGTFLDYLTRLRIEKACFILQHSEVKVFQVAPMVGYQDPRYFTQVFKKIMGKTPSEYRDHHSI